MSVMTERAWLIDGELAGRRYRVEPPRKALSGHAGARSGVRSGVSLDFNDYREYYPGDDLRTLDWGVYARTDKLTVKLFHEEVSPHVDIVLDGTASMGLDGSRKGEAAAWLTALLWSAGRNGDCTARAWLLGDRLDPLGESMRRPAEWKPFSLSSLAEPQKVLSATEPVWRKRGLRFLVSDLLWECEPASVVRRMATGAAQLVVVQLLARADAEPPPRGRWRLTSPESRATLDLFVDAAAQNRYRSTLQALQNEWLHACRECGATFVTVVAEDILAARRVDALERNNVLIVG